MLFYLFRLISGGVTWNRFQDLVENWFEDHFNYPDIFGGQNNQGHVSATFYEENSRHTCNYTRAPKLPRPCPA